jgi:hypothetical protein
MIECGDAGGGDVARRGLLRALLIVIRFDLE